MNFSPRFKYPPAIARTLGFDLVDSGERSATIEIVTDLARHANPMGTVHGGVLCDIADAAIGTAHATGLGEGESFTSLDLQINFFHPVWSDRLRAIAKAVHLGRTVSRYICDILNSERKTRGAGDQHSDDIKRRESIRKIGENLRGFVAA
jgi:uncharacterized protein (TIGR00369 family)